ncbi:hypothetical protein DDW13_00690 [Acidianus hospitalis]|uniref:Uncharacterized protein n=2 Tax=Acidianus TaxID=12914 RepID=A0A2U9ID27_9CREN|nr:hypothetical protein DDW13_00690 [Acidianus hospitalis]
MIVDIVYNFSLKYSVEAMIRKILRPLNFHLLPLVILDFEPGRHIHNDLAFAILIIRKFY